MPATKDEIAEKFMQLALQHGFRRTSVEDVARALRISKATIYESFRGKLELQRYAIELTARAQRRRVEASLTSTTALGRIEQVISIALADVRRAFASGLPADVGGPSELSSEVNDAVFRPLLRDLIAEGVARGQFHVIDVDLAAAFFMSIGMEAVAAIHSDPSRRPEGAMLEAVTRMLGCDREGK